MINIVMNMKDRDFVLRGISLDHGVSREKVEEVMDQVIFWVQGRLLQAFEQIEAAKADHMVTVRLANEAWHDGREYGRREMRVESKLQQFGMDREVEVRNITEALKRYKAVADDFSQDKKNAERGREEALLQLSAARMETNRVRDELDNLKRQMDSGRMLEGSSDEDKPAFDLEAFCDEDGAKLKVTADENVRIVTDEIAGLSFLREETITAVGKKLTRRIYGSGELPGDYVLMMRPHSWWRRLIVSLAERVCG